MHDRTLDGGEVGPAVARRTGTLYWLPVILDHAQLDPTETLLMLALADHVNAEDRCFVGIAKLSARARTSYATARRRLKGLEDRGYLERSRRRREDGNLSVYDFTLNREAFDEPSLNLSASADPALSKVSDDQRSDERAMTSAQQGERAEPLHDEPPHVEGENRDAAPQLARLDEWPDNLPAVVVESGLLERARELNMALEASLIERGFVDVAGKAIGKRWLLDMEALLRVDGRPPEQVRWVIGWLSRGDDRVASFWRSNIRSPAKLRQQWAVMREQWHNLQRTTQSRTGQQFDRAVREMGMDPEQVKADTSSLVRELFGRSDPVDEERNPLMSGAVDVESREE